MIWQAGVVDVADLWMAVEELGERHRALLMSFHSRAERLDAAEYQPGVERRTAKAQRVDDVADFFGVFLLLGDHTAADDVGVSVQILRRGMDDDIDAQFEGTLQVRGQERVVRDRDRSTGLGHFADRRDVDDVEQWVAGGFDPDTLGVLRHGLPDVLRVTHANENEIDPHLAEDRVEQAVRSTVDIVTRDDLITGLEEVHGGGDGRHAGARGATINSTFESGNVLFKCSSGGVAAACVVEAAMGLEIVPAERG